MHSYQIQLSQDEAWFLDDLLTAPADDARKLASLDNPDVRLIRDQIGQVLLRRRGCLQLNETQLDLLRKLIPSCGTTALTSVSRPLKIRLHSDILEAGMWEHLGIS